MCWHKWDVKKKVTRVFFERITFGKGFLTAFTLSGVTMAGIVAVFPSTKEASPVSFGDVLGCWVLFTIIVGLLYFFLGLFGLLILETGTQKKDKICRKCHLTILDASQYEREIQIPYRNRVKAEAQSEKEAKNAADAVFADRKQMWFKAND
jgi:hypothetical protein